MFNLSPLIKTQNSKELIILIMSNCQNLGAYFKALGLLQLGHSMTTFFPH